MLAKIKRLKEDIKRDHEKISELNRRIEALELLIEHEATKE